ncbi:uncharacterized protein LOC115630424 [Scaptodrosophila lebanonensis]|uniref:Male-enhanced antigen 1 n=1 Tax=Drosophila lebanonensis TaxID=7225 RepID=A0A6J2U6P3_DROLE|nr:uncharacterized protein LOC115630424 [Scaptodrosophila lebanonensis]
MGGPELPTDPVEDHLHTPTIEHPQIVQESDGDESDNSEVYDGYQPLAMDEDGGAIAQQEPESSAENIDLTTAPVSYGDPNIPPIESADAEIERQVWNEPRPQELQIELDKTRTEQILSAMSKITLPNVTVPDWAVGVPEERWKHELLERIQNRRQTGDNNNI